MSRYTHITGTTVRIKRLHVKVHTYYRDYCTHKETACQGTNILQGLLYVQRDQDWLKGHSHQIFYFWFFTKPLLVPLEVTLNYLVKKKIPKTFEFETVPVVYASAGSQDFLVTHTPGTRDSPQHIHWGVETPWWCVHQGVYTTYHQWRKYKNSPVMHTPGSGHSEVRYSL